MPAETPRAPSGTHDVLPPASRRWEALVAGFAALVDAAGYGLVQSPVFEDLAVFAGVGESTDIVRKEMYVFSDRGGRQLALRPEGTASVVRAFVQHHPSTPFKAWYVAPNFRYERPQAGRYRQHHQLGIEAIGSADADLDVEVVGLAWDLLEAVGLRRVVLCINSLGDSVCRPAYVEALRGHLEARRGDLCDEHRPRFEENPLRVLDCKRRPCQEATREAPRMVDHLCEACRVHFQRVQEGLGALGVPFVIETRLVRGLDYYTRTTFELQASALETAQSAVGGGGRYDGLVAALGGPDTPGIGFGMGIERLLLACDAEDVFPVPPSPVEVFVVDVVGGARARDLTARLRRQGIGADRAFDGRSMRAQMKLADRSGARFALIVGPEEHEAGTVAVRDMREGGEQQVVPLDDAIDVVKERR